jgi:hypothetical protein
VLSFIFRNRGPGWAVALGELDVRHEWRMLNFAVRHVEAFEHAFLLGMQRQIELELNLKNLLFRVALS